MFYLGLFITAAVLIFVVLVPICIMPLFNKFSPMDPGQMRTDVESLASSCQYPLSNIEVVDGSTRSSHSNAFQYGVGPIKKIVIFDTLLE